MDQRLDLLSSLTSEERQRIEHLWEFWARPKQLPPEGDWRIWLILAGRGFGKTRTGAEWARRRVKCGAKHLIFAGATAGDLRDIMIEGESGILAVSPKAERPRYEPSKSRLTWPNGAKAILLSADEPNRFRGKQSDTIWADELAAWRYPDAWDQLMLGFRLGRTYGIKPQGIVSTTPRAIPLVRKLIARATDPTTVRITTGSTFENAPNLAGEFIDEVKKQYEGTRLGRQELYAEILDDNPGALWARSNIDRLRVGPSGCPQLQRLVVAVDPAVTSTETSDETGIVVAGLGVDGHGYVLDDLSGKFSPADWAKRTVAAYHNHRADRIVPEVNNGGDLVTMALRTVDPSVPVRPVHAARGKRTRAEPISALYEQGKVHHVGSFPLLEDQLCSWDPTMSNDSPDRLDALVWALSDLMLRPANARRETVYRDPDDDYPEPA